MNPLMWLRVALVAAPFIVWVVQELRMLWAVRAAIEETKVEQAKICTGRVATIESTLNLTGFRTVVVIRDAEQGVSLTPSAKPELVALCKKDRACRDRGKP